jgi:uncharacterized membrane protein YeaQ/YmgE (transglycosylase-associated protein family)
VAAPAFGLRTCLAVIKGAKSMDPVALIIFLIIGAIAGWLAGQIMTGGGFGLVGNIIVGIVGAFVAGLLLPGFFPIGGYVGWIIHAAIGAIIVLFVIGLVKRA